MDLTPDDPDSAFGALMNKCSQDSTKSQQEVLKPASSDVNESSQDPIKSHRDESLGKTDLSHATSLPAEGTIKAAAVEGMTVGLYTTPGGATPILDADEVILDEDPIPGVLLTLICLGDILTGLNLHPDPIRGTDLILTAKPNPDRDLMEGIAIILGVTTV